MAKFIEIKGRARNVVAAGVLVALAISIFFPSLLSQVTGSGGRGFSFFRLGHVHQQKTNLVGHWIGTAKGSYATGFILAFEGEEIRIAPDVKTTEGRVVLRLRKYRWDSWWDFVWSEALQDGRKDTIAIPVPSTGLYDLQLSYFAFAGSVAFDWTVE